MAQDVQTATADASGEAKISWRVPAGYWWNVTGVAVTAVTTATPPAVLERDDDYLTSTVQGVSDTAQGGPYTVPNGSVLSVTWTGLNAGDPVKAILVYQPMRPTGREQLLQGALRFSQPAASVTTIGGIVTVRSNANSDLLASGTLTLVTGPGPATQIATITVANLPATFGALLLATDGSSGGASVACAKASNGAAEYSSAALGGSNFTGQVIVPFSNEAGDTLTLTVYSFQAPGKTAEFSLYGLGYCPVQVRSDGRAYPVGNFVISNALVATTPAGFIGSYAGLRYMVKSFSSFVVNVSGAATLWGRVIVNATAVDFGHVAVNSGAASANFDVPAGILVDENTSLGVGVGFAPSQARSTMVFDAVPA